MVNGYKKDYKLEEKFFEHKDLRELVRHSSEVYKDKVAFVTKIKGKNESGEKEVRYINTTYGDFFEEIGQLGTALWEKGYQGKRIGLIGENSYHWILSYFAAVCGLGVIVPLDKLLQKEELENLISRGEVSCVFCDRKTSPYIEEILKEGRTELKELFGLDFTPEGGSSVGDLLSRGKELISGGMRDYLDAPIDRDAMSHLMFTSGTTQASKGVMLCHRNITAVTYYMDCEELFFPDDVSMLFVPLHHVFGMGGVMVFITQGIKCVFCDGLKYISNNMVEYGVSVMMTVPLLLENVYRKIWKGIDKQGKRKTVERALKICSISEKFGIYLRRKLFKSIIDQLGGSMRFFINGASALDPVVDKGLNDFGILTVSGYGLTETSPTIASGTYRYLKHGSVGKNIPFIETKIMDPDEDGIGELVVKGDIVMLGYYKDPEATAEVIKDGWFHTGDLAYYDKDGYLWISGRKKNVIVMKNGKNIFPEEIETLINLLPYVSESMVFNKTRAGESNEVVLWAKVVYDQEYLTENNLTKEDLDAKFAKDLEEINDSMPPYKMVKHYFLSDKPTIKTTTLKTKRNDEMKVIDKEMEELGLL